MSDTNNSQPQQTQTISATFMGADGDVGYTNGQTYNLKKWDADGMVYISREDGSGQVAYDSMESLEENFKLQNGDSPTASSEGQPSNS